MCHAVKLVLTSLMLLGALPAQALESYVQRSAYADPGVSGADYGFFYRVVSQQPLWRLPLAAGEVQIVRLQVFELISQQPFYWAQTRLDERRLQLKVQLALEIWQGPELRWQRSVALDRALRLMGPELRGTGMAILNPLAELPAGALTPTGRAAERIAGIKQDLLIEAARRLQQDYSQHH